MLGLLISGPSGDAGNIGPFASQNHFSGRFHDDSFLLMLVLEPRYCKRSQGQLSMARWPQEEQQSEQQLILPPGAGSLGSGTDGRT